MLEVLAGEPLFELDYAEVIDEQTFEIAKVDTLHKRAIVAGWINEVRLIDNMPMESGR
jgi:pantoate--beta-alanine ligase